MKRREFISSLAKALIAMPLIASRAAKGNPILVAFVICLLAISGFIFYQLYQLCKKVLPNTPKPDKGDGNSSIKTPLMPDIGGRVMKLAMEPQYFWKADRATPDFVDPAGGIYDGFMAVMFETTTDLKSWEPCGCLKCWMSEKFLLMVQYGNDGVATSRQLISAWSKLDLLPAVKLQCPESEQRFFRTTSQYLQY